MWSTGRVRLTRFLDVKTSDHLWVDDADGHRSANLELNDIWALHRLDGIHREPAWAGVRHRQLTLSSAESIVNFVVTTVTTVTTATTGGAVAVFGAVALVLLIALLIIKELAMGSDNPVAVRTRRAVNLAVAPLVLTVFAIAAAKVTLILH